MKKVLIVTVIILAISILSGIFYALKAQDSTKNVSFSFLDKLITKKATLDSQIVQIEKEMKATASGDTTWHTGKRGGVYYINANGNKVYRKRK